MQITNLEQCFNRQATVKMGMKKGNLFITYLITDSYEHRS